MLPISSVWVRGEVVSWNDLNGQDMCNGFRVTSDRVFCGVPVIVSVIVHLLEHLHQHRKLNCCMGSTCVYVDHVQECWQWNSLHVSPICNPGRSRREVMPQMLEQYPRADPVITFGDGGHKCRKFPCPVCRAQGVLLYKRTTSKILLQDGERYISLLPENISDQFVCRNSLGASWWFLVQV